MTQSPQSTIFGLKDLGNIILGRTSSAEESIGNGQNVLLIL